MHLFVATNYKISALVTKSYSNSFYLSTLLLDKKVKQAIHAIYGFVRFADEIVDTLHEFDKRKLLEQFETDMNDALQNGISLNPILNSFQLAVNEYKIPRTFIDAFLSSMKMDLEKHTYLTQAETDKYVYGSANVVGLMCLKVFCNEDVKLFNELREPAEMLGSAFQKVNFLRDLKDDTEILNRNYFPAFEKEKFDENKKLKLIKEIEEEFNIALMGIIKLPGRSKLAVYTAYNYYRKLLFKIKKSEASDILKRRIRISNILKLSIMARSAIEYKLKLI